MFKNNKGALAKLITIIFLLIICLKLLGGEFRVMTKNTKGLLIKQNERVLKIDKAIE